MSIVAVPGSFAAGTAVSTGGAVTTAAAAAGPPGWILNGVLIGVSILTAVLKKKPSPPPPEAQGFTLKENPTDPYAPWLVPYGEGWVRTPLLQQVVSPAKTNAMKAARAQRLTKTFHCGAGPMDGRELRVKHGGEVLWDIIDADAPAARKQLTDISNGSRRQWVFPERGVDHSSVAIFLDGTLIGSVAGGETDSSVKDTVTAQAVAPRSFSRSGVLASTKDHDIPIGAVRVGGILPVDGTVDAESMTLVAHLASSSVPVRYQDGTSQTGRTITIPRKQIGYAITDKGEVYFYLSLNPSVSPSLFTKFVVSYTTVSGPVFTLSLTSDQRTVATFRDPVAAGTVTATYRTSTVSEDFKYLFRLGTRDQDPIAFDEGEAGDRATYLVGSELTQGTVRRYSTVNEVDDLVVGIDSGPDGFFASEGGFGPIARHVQIRLKESDAADQIGSGVDLSSGWIDLKRPDGQGVSFRLEDFLQGTAHWFYGIAALYAYTKTGKLEADQTYTLPRKQYDVEVVATDAANANDKGTVDTALYHSALHFATATEIRRIGLVVPYQSDLSLQIEEDESIELDDLIEVKAKWRQVWVPDANSTYDATSGRPEPGSFAHTRNPVWIACDHITDPLFGAGRYFTWANIASDATRWAATLAAASYCDDTVTLENGETETRSLCDITLGEDGRRRTLGETLAAVLGGSGVLAYWRGGWNFLIDQDDDPVQDPVSGGDFTIVEEDDLFDAKLEMLGIEDIPSELEIAYRDARKDDEDDTRMIVLQDPQPSPRIKASRELPAVRRYTQVDRVGALMLQQMRRQLRTIVCTGTWGRGLRLLQLDPGDIVRFTSTRLGITSGLYRVFVVGWSSEMKPGVVLVQHDPAAYTTAFAGPNGAVTPGARTTQVTLSAFSKLTVQRVALKQEAAYA